MNELTNAPSQAVPQTSGPVALGGSAAGIQIHRAERADHLVDALAGLLATPLGDPFAIEQVAVPTHGVERWLAQRLADRLGTSPDRTDGVCAGIAFPSPARLIATAVAAVDELAGPDDPWRPNRAVWALLGTIDTHRGSAWAEPLWAYLDGASTAGESGRRWATARQLIDLFERYATYRPAMLERWRAGWDTDAVGEPLPADRTWQAILWRELRTELGVPGPAERLAVSARRLREEPERSALPERLSLLGLTRLDPAHGAVLASLAVHREVHLWLPHPSPALWQAVQSDLADARSRGALRLGPRIDDPTATATRHRLLGYLGRDIRELQTCLAVAFAEGVIDQPVGRPGQGQGATAVAVQVAPVHVDPEQGAAGPTLLQLLQRDLTANAAPLAEPPELAPDDTSVAFHAAHGPDRQVEVLREVLVGLLADDATLEPRDIVVMCPDIEAYAPLIAAAFGLDATDPAGATRPEHPGHRLRVRLADRSLREVNPLLATLSRLLALPAARMSAAELLDLCALPPVARRFGFGPDELTRLTELVTSAGVRWGLDAARRKPYQMTSFAQNTWAAGMDRLLLGVAMDETGQHFLGTALPLDDVDSSDVDLVGRLAEFVDRVRRCTDQLTNPQPLSEWVRRFREALGDLTAVVGRDSWQLGHAHARLTALELDDVETDGAPDGIDPAPPLLLTRSDVTALLEDAFRGRPTRANFRTGSLTMCTLQPMRSIPHRVVCLLGVDDGTFPRRSEADGDDLLAREDWVGDHDARSEDRQLLLDAVLAAQDRLIIVYGGMDPQTGDDRPPAVPIGGLLDALDATARTTDGRPVRSQLTTRHPLQPFDRRNFATSGTDRPLSFDAAALRGARAAGGQRTAAPLRYPPDQPLEALDAGLVELADLQRFFRHPIRALLKDRAGLTLARVDEQPEQLPISLDGLQSWAIGDRMLRAHLAGADVQRLAQAEWRRGDLPPRELGRREIDKVSRKVEEVAALVRPWLVGERERHDLTLDLAGGGAGGVLQGSVGDLYGSHLVRVGYSALSARQRLAAWVDLLALSCAEPEVGWRAIVIGGQRAAALGPVPPSWVRPLLIDLLSLRQAGLCAPIPFAPRTSESYAQLRRANLPFDPRARRDLERRWADRERDDAYAHYYPTLDDLMRQPSIAAEQRGGAAESTRFGSLARRIFDPLATLEDQL